VASSRTGWEVLPVDTWQLPRRNQALSETESVPQEMREMSAYAKLRLWSGGKTADRRWARLKGRVGEDLYSNLSRGV